MHAYSHSYTHIIHTLILTHMHTCLCTYPHSYTHIHSYTYMYTYTYSHIHTDKYTYRLRVFIAVKKHCDHCKSLLLLLLLLLFFGFLRQGLASLIKKAWFQRFCPLSSWREHGSVQTEGGWKSCISQAAGKLTETLGSVLSKGNFKAPHSGTLSSTRPHLLICEIMGVNYIQSDVHTHSRINIIMW